MLERPSAGFLLRFGTISMVLVLGLAVAHAQSAMDLRRSAQRAAAEEDYLRAASLLRQSLTQNPNFLEAHEDLAEVLFLLGEDAESERHARIAFRLSGGRGRSRLILARVNLRRGGEGLSEARQLLESSLREEGETPEILEAWGALEVVQHRFPQAARYFSQSLQRAPGRLQAMLPLFLLEERLGNVQRASLLMEQMLRLHGAEPTVLEQGVRFFRLLGDFSRAVGLSDRLLALVQGSPLFQRAAWERLRLDLERHRLNASLDLQPATRLAEEAIRRDPSQPLSYALLGAVRLRLGDYPAAERAWREALERARDDEMLRLGWERAVRQLPVDHALRQGPAFYHANQAASQMARNLLDQARESYRRLLQVDPLDKGGRWGLAQTWRDLGFPGMYLATLLDLEALPGSTRVATRSLALEADRELKRELEYWRERWLRDQSLAGLWRLDPDTYRRWRDPSAWAVNQPGPGGRPTRLGVFVLDRLSLLDGYPDQALFLLEAFADLLQSHPSPWPRREGQGRHGILPLILHPVADTSGTFDAGQALVPNLEDAIARARARGLDYFLLLRWDTGKEVFTVHSSLHLASSGRTVTEFVVSRLGTERVLPALRELVQLVHQHLPIRTRLVARREIPGKSLALVPVGSLHGLQVGDELAVVRTDSLNPAAEYPLLRWPAAARVASLRLTTVEDWLSEGELMSGADQVSLSDTVVFLRPAPQTSLELPAAMDDLQERILRIR